MIDDILSTIEPPAEGWQPVAMARGLLRGYHDRWHSQQQCIELIEVEATYEAPLYNLESQRPSRTFSLAGKIDKLTRENGYTVLWDHKTTSMDITDPDAVYWRQLAVESQPSHYTYLLHLNGVKVDRVCWDVVRKPGIKPRRLKKDELAEINSVGRCNGYLVSEECRRAVADGMTDEDAELYELRVWQECTEQPDRYFQRRGVTRLNDEIAEYATELWQVGQAIRDTRREGRWFRNSGACLLYGSPCEYLGICSGYDTPDSGKWTTREDVHAELEMQGGKDVLTNSRIRCFQTCRRKHQYRYEMGLVRIEEEEREALMFGSLWHELLDNYWKGVAYGNCNDRPVSEVGQSADRPA